jgi:hypothetical protein
MGWHSSSDRAGVVLPLTHPDGDSFTAAFFPEAPVDQTAVEYTGADGLATQVDNGDNDGPGTGRLNRT